MTKNINGDIYSDLITSANQNIMNGQARGDNRITQIIVHHNATTNKDVAMNTWLESGSAGTSAHYEITPNEIVGCVGENSIAYHAGNWDVNVNSIGLEHVNSSGAPSWSVDGKTIENSAKLIVDICKRYGLPINRNTIKGHNEIVATACPGGINVDQLVKRAQDIANGDKPKPQPKVTYIGTSAHVQDIGWKSYSQTIGTVGQSKRLEAFVVPDGLEGEGHIQDLGWTARRKSGEIIGTAGSSKRLEAIKLYGNIKYRVHVQNIGWTDWVESGQVAGTTGQSKRIEAIEVINK